MKKYQKIWSLILSLLLLLLYIFPTSSALAEDIGGSETGFSSLRLIAEAEDDSIFKNDSHLLASHENIYLLQYPDEQSTRDAFFYYREMGISIQVDEAVYAAEMETEGALAELSMTSEENPIAQLEQTEGAISGTYDIALIDTGFDDAAYALSVLGGEGRDDNGHGTQMAKRIFEQNPDARILSIKALDENGRGSISSVYAAVCLAMEADVKIINLSLSAEAAEPDGLLTSILREAAEKGIVVVGAAGNNGEDASTYLPGNVSEAVITGSCDQNGIRRELSNYGENVDYNIVSESTSEAAAILSGWVSFHGIESIPSALNKGLIYETNYAAENQDEQESEQTVQILWGKGSVVKTAENTYAIKADPGYRIWRTAGLNQYYDYYQPVVDEEGLYHVDPDVKTLRVYFLSDEEYGAILKSAGSEANLKYYWDDPKWFFQYGTKVLNNEEFWTVYKDYYAHQALKKLDGKTAEAAWTFGVPAGTQVITQKLNYVPKAGQTLSAVATGLSENNRVEGVDDTWNDYVFHIDSGYGAGQDIHLNCSQNGGWFPISRGSLSFHITSVNENNHTFGGTVNWTSDDSREQPQANTFSGSYVPPEGYLKIQKQSSIPEITEQNGSYSLAGAVYTVYSGQTVKGTLTTDASGASKTLKLAPGTYTVKETSAPKSYELDEQSYSVQITSAHTTSSPYVLKTSELPGFDRMSIRIIKEAKNTYANGFPLEGAEFVIKYFDNTEGDTSGSPERTWKIRTVKDEASGAYVASLDDPESFVPEESDPLYMADGKVILPVGTISIEEVKPAAGYTLTGACLIAEDGSEIELDDGKYIGVIRKTGDGAHLSYGNLYTMLNTPIEVHTTAENQKDSTHYATAGAPVTIVDTVTMAGTDCERLVNDAGEWDYIKYRLKGEVRDKESGQLLASAQKDFITDEFDGHVETLNYYIEDTAKLEGHTIFVSEYLYSYVTVNDGKGAKHDVETLVACEDETLFPDLPEEQKESQRIHFPILATTMLNDKNGTHEAEADEELSLTDRVEYKGLIPGCEYELRGTLMSKKSGKAALDQEGKQISSSVRFTAEEAAGLVEVNFRYQNPALAGDTVVAFEELFVGDKKIAAHEDIEAMEQSIHLSSPKPSDETPKTGDESRLLLWISIPAAALGMFALALILWKKKRSFKGNS